MTFDHNEFTRLGTNRRRRLAANEKERERLEELIRAAPEHGYKAPQIIEITGYTRESVRLLTMTPEQREQEREKRRLREAKPPKRTPTSD